jgi:TATA-binding protein-associated factor Taf7
MASEGISPEETSAGVGVAVAVAGGGDNEEEGGGDEDERMEELEGSEEEKTGDAAGPENSRPASGEVDEKFNDRDNDDNDDDDEKMDSGTEDDEEDGVDEVAERNRKLLSSGCGKLQGGERKKILHAFWSALWPILEDSGWSKVRALLSVRSCDVL